MVSTVSDADIKPGNDPVILVLVESDIQFALTPPHSLTAISTYHLFDSRDK
jgi:hypothetical protein